MQTLEKEDISRIVSVQMDGSYDVATTVYLFLEWVLPYAGESSRK